MLQESAITAQIYDPFLLKEANIERLRALVDKLVQF